MAGVKRKLVSVTNIPEMIPPPAPSSSTRPQRTAETATSHPLLTLNLSSSSSFLDPAEMAILKANESKERRKKEETRLELEKIQQRVQQTLTEYQPETPDGQRAETPSAKDVDLHAVRSPEELYKLLADVRLRTKYQQHVTVLLLGHEAALEDRERLLQSINEFFQETTAGNTAQLLEEISSEEIDLEEATAGLESALRTAQAAGDRLLGIKKDMGQLFAIVQAFPDTKKGRKKLEKALLKAQEEVESLQNQLTVLHGEMETSRDKIARLQKQVDAKTTECEKLKKAESQVEQLQNTNAGLQSQLTAAKEAAEKAKTEMERERKERLQLMAKKEEVKEVVRGVEKAGGADSSKVAELAAALENEKKAVEELEAKIEAREGEFQEKMATVVAEHEAEVQEMRSRYEDQMKSLMEDDLFSDAGSARDEGDGHQEESEEGVDAGELLQIPEGGDTSATVETLKFEYHQQELKLKDEVNEVKNKSRKTVTGLKAQLAEAQNRLSDEKNNCQKEIDALQMEKTSIESERDEKCEQISSLEETTASLQAQLDELTAREEERAAQIDQLQSDLQSALAGRLGGAGPPKACRLADLDNRSSQWLEGSPGQMTPASCGRPHSTSPPLPVLPMDEVQFSCEPSATRLFHQPFEGGGTPRSVHFPGGQTPFSEGSQFPGGTQFFHGSLDQSGSSRQLGDSTTVNAVSGAPPQGLHMLIQSRLSHHSPQGYTSLSHDHPVVAEWVKAYDLIMKFRDRMVDMLRDDDRFENEVEDLRSVEGVPLMRDEEVQGQVTQMRFSLTLMLHQMEVTLQETFGRLLNGESGGGDGETGGEEGGTEMKNLRQAKARMKERLSQAEDMHKMELQQSKETIANLSNKVETLRMEIASLRRSMAANERGGANEVPLSMFTSLDLAHNTQELESAVESEKITAQAYQRVKEEMSAYLSIPTQRMAHVGKRRRQKQLAEHLVCEVRRELHDREDKVEKVVERIQSRDQLQQKEFGQRMEGLRRQRTTLARELTVKLGEMEEVTKSLLIKPIYGGWSHVRHQNLITPLPRPIPVRRSRHPGHTHKRRTRSGSAIVQGSNDHHHMRDILQEQADQGRIGFQTSPSPHHYTQPPTRERRERRGGEGLASMQGTPLPPPLLHTHLLRHTRTERGGEGCEAEWQVEDSRPPTRQETLPFSPLMFHTPPAIPSIMEANTVRKKHLLGLLKELGLSSPAAAPTPQPHHHDHSSTVESRLVAHTIQDPLRSHGHSRARSSRTSSLALPPISVPSRISGPLAAIY